MIFCRWCPAEILQFSFSFPVDSSARKWSERNSVRLQSCFPSTQVSMIRRPIRPRVAPEHCPSCNPHLVKETLMSYGHDAPAPEKAKKLAVVPCRRKSQIPRSGGRIQTSHFYGCVDNVSPVPYCYTQQSLALIPISTRPSMQCLTNGISGQKKTIATPPQHHLHVEESNLPFL